MSPAFEKGPGSPAETSTDITRTYLNDIGKVELLTAEQEVELATAIEKSQQSQQILMEAGSDLTEADRAGYEEDIIEGNQARAAMIEANLRLVVSIANRYTGRGLEKLDAIQEGNLGLMRAVEKFDYKKGFKFSTYATWWIKNSIHRGLAYKGGAIRLPANMYEVIRQVEGTRARLIKELGREPVEEEMAEATGISPEKLRKTWRYLDQSKSISLDSPVGEGQDELGHFVADSRSAFEFTKAEDDIYLASLLEQLQSAGLDEREQFILEKRIVAARPMTLTAIAKEFGVSREVVRNIESRTKAKIKPFTEALLGEVRRQSPVYEEAAETSYDDDYWTQLIDDLIQEFNPGGLAEQPRSTAAIGLKLSHTPGESLQIKAPTDNQLEIGKIKRTISECLTDRQRTVFNLTCGLENGSPKTLQEIAGILGISPSTVRVHYIAAISKIKEKLGIRPSR